VVLFGGNLARNSYICTGAAVASAINEIRVDLCLLGTNGISLAEGVTDYEWEVAHVKKAIIKSAAKSALLSISEKLGTVQKVQVCQLNAIDYLITELSPNDEKLKRYGQICKVQ
jgi:DeoR/GlpR family transcriptional regulator of sugar metabolism